MINSHLLSAARLVQSPNQDNRAHNSSINLVVIHNISLPPGVFGTPYIEDFFTNQLDEKQHPYFKTITSLKVSSHLFIKRDGEMVQFVPFDKRAWHAGKSCFNGRENCNDFSIGIELEGTDDIAYTDAQYASLSQSIIALKQHYPINDITGHSDIAPKRKTDPGAAFDWKRLHDLLAIKPNTNG